MTSDLGYEKIRATEPVRVSRRGNWLVAACAFAVTIAAFGVFVVIGSGTADVVESEMSTSTTAATTTTEEPIVTTTTMAPTSTPLSVEKPLSPEQRALVATYFLTWNSGDSDAFFVLFDESHVEVFRGEDDSIQQVARGDDQYDRRFVGAETFYASLGASYEADVDRCSLEAGTISCVAWMMDPLIDRTIGRFQIVVRLDFKDGLIVRRFNDCGSWCGQAILARQQFGVWIRRYDPDIASKTWAGLDPVLTEESARLWLEYLPIYFEEGL